MNKKTKITISISVVALLLIVVGVSYAYFSAQITGGEDSTTLNVTGGSLGLTVSGGNSITVSNTYPQDGAVATKTITVTGNNTTELTMPYTLNLVIDANTFGSSSIKYTLTSTNTDNTGTIIPSISSQTGITTGTSTISLGSGSFEGDTTNKVHTYVLNIYYPDTGASQNAEQGKSLSAHVTVTSEKAESISLLSSAILTANGGASAIAAKGNPNFVSGSPYFSSYSDNNFSGTANNTTLSEGSSYTNYYTYSSSYTFNSTTGGYTLVSPQICQYSSCYTSLIGKYIVDTYGSESSEGASSTDLSRIYKVTGDTATNITTIQSSYQTNYNSADSGVYAMTDDYGTSYYYRGAVDNNWVSFAGYYWRIVRITGNGAVKLIYSGSTAPTEAQKYTIGGTTVGIGNVQFNSSATQAENTGYMYTTGLTHGLTTSSLLKTTLETWYSSYLSTYDSSIADVVYCNDRTTYSGTILGYTYSGTGVGTTKTWFGVAPRLLSSTYGGGAGGTGPSFVCANENDAFTKSDTTYGNGVLSQKVGFLTADELVAAGLSYGAGGAGTGATNYLSSNAFWSGTPYNLSSWAYVLQATNTLYESITYNGAMARPVIALTSDTLVKGSGTWNDPYVVQ